jgi:hypothetical protein
LGSRAHRIETDARHARKQIDAAANPRAARHEQYLETRVLTYPLTIGKTKSAKALQHAEECTRCRLKALNDVTFVLRIRPFISIGRSRRWTSGGQRRSFHS